MNIKTSHATAGALIITGLLGSITIGIHEIVGMLSDTTIVVRKHVGENCQYKLDEGDLYVTCKVHKEDN